MSTPHPDVAAVLEAHRFVRWIPARALPRAKDAAGNALCGWCHGPLPPRRSSWCSDGCSSEFWIRLSSAHVGARVNERDQGVCALCGIDTRRLRSLLERIRWRSRPSFGPGGTIEPSELAKFRWWRARAELSRRGIHVSRDALTIPALWEADHILPVVEGGGCCGLSNYRTLCVPCHRAETRRLSARLAERRRPQRPLFPINQPDKETSDEQARTAAR